MSLYEDQTSELGDYAPAKKKGRVSRTRKALIVTMALGAFAAMSGAGTFASFTASTDNPGGTDGENNPFRTPDFELTNTVLSRSGDDTTGVESECRSSDEAEEFPAGDPLEGSPNASYCEVLFAFNDFATTATANLLLENTGSSDGDLLFYSATVNHLGTSTDQADTDELTCVIDTTLLASDSAHQALCGDWTLSIQEHMVTSELGGTGLPNFDNASRNGECVLPPNANAPAGANCSTFRAFNDLPLFSEDEAVNIGSLPAGESDDDDAGDSDDNDDRRYFRITAELTKPSCPGDVDEDGFDDSTGVGCYNELQNGSARIQLRWVLAA